MIIGITGTLKAGKGNLVKALQERGFEHHSVRGFLSEELEKRSLEINRDNLVAVANELRANHEPSYIVHQLLQKVHGKNAVIESIRNPGEVELLRQTPDAYLISMDAPRRSRYDRMLQAKEGVDGQTFEEFSAAEDREMDSEDPNKQQIAKCMDAADYHFWADYHSGFEARGEFVEGKTGFLNLFGDGRAITKPEKAMMKAVLESHSSKCLSRHTGAIIQREEIDLSQGYNGPVRGTKHCEERGGCIRRIKNIPSGERLDLCRAAHAEVNAIINAGRNGVNVIGATMYATNYPCNRCAVQIVQSGIQKVVYLGTYWSELAKEILDEAEVETERYRHGLTPQSIHRFFSWKSK